MHTRQSDEVQPAHIWKPDVYDHAIKPPRIRLKLLQRRQGGIGLEARKTGLSEGLTGHRTYYAFVINHEERGHWSDGLGYFSLWLFLALR